jgi:hypothetical protein
MFGAVSGDPLQANEPVFTLVYLSRETAALARADLLALLEVSRRRNAERGISGLLVHKAGHFLQILEGPQAAVEGLMVKIAADPRHGGVVVVLRQAGTARAFADWSMALADWPDEDAATTAAWSALLEQIRESGGRLGPAGGVIAFARSLAHAGYLG